MILAFSHRLQRLQKPGWIDSFTQDAWSSGRGYSIQKKYIVIWQRRAERIPFVERLLPDPQVRILDVSS